MKPNHTSQSVLEALRKAAGVHTRQRAMLFLLRSLLCLAAAVPLLMIADVLFHFPGLLRLAGTLGVVLAGVALLLVAFGMAFFARPPLLRVARLLESRNPALGSKLVNILQLDAESRREDAAPLTRELARQAVVAAGDSLDLAALPPLARESRMKRRFLQSLAAPILLVLLTVFGGVPVRLEWLRFLDPFGDHPPFSLTRLEILRPVEGDRVRFGASALVEVRASGHRPRELFLTAMPVDGDGAAILLPMIPRGDGSFAVRLDDLRQPLELTAHTADWGARSHRRVLDVILTPEFGPARVRLVPPAYTGQPPRDLPFRFTALQALEGTQIEFFLQSNRPLGVGALIFETGEPPAVSMPLQPEVEGPADTAVARLIAGRSGRFSFGIVDVDGNPPAQTPASSLTVTHDLPPAITITIPESDALVVENLMLPVIVDATDDYGLSSVRLHISINDVFMPLTSVTFETPDVRRHRLEHLLNLAELGAVDEDRIVIFAEAVDTRPDPQITRTDTRRLEVITEEQYNDYLREKADVAMIAGKYEALLDRFHEQVEAQRKLEEKLAELAEQAATAEDPSAFYDKLSEAVAGQTELNRRLEELASEMEDFGRDQPVYDFEKELHEGLKEQAEALRESVAQNELEVDRALESGPPPPAPPDQEMLESLADAAREQRERLEGGQQQAEKEIREPLAELAQLHELMKNFNLFKELAAEQEGLADQSKAYDGKPDLNAEDRLALRDLGARQRDLARKLEQLSNKLKADAAAAAETFPEAAASAEELADGIDSAGMPGLARRAAQNLLDAKADEGHAQAKNLHEEMDRLFDDAGEEGRNAAGQGLDQALRLKRGLNPGDSLRQMMLSRNFRNMPGEGGTGMGMAGLMAMGGLNANSQLLGGEALMDGPIARSLTGAGDQGSQGTPGAPTARLDAADLTAPDAESARRTGTPGSSSLLMEYENIADAYFRRLTTKP